MNLFDLDRSPRQKEAFMGILNSALGRLPYRTIHLQGSVRGGKSICAFGTISVLCNMFPNLRVFVIRATYPVLLMNTVPSFEKIVKTYVKKSSSTSNYYYEFKNGSRVIFKSANLDRDKTLSSLQGLEANIIMIDELSEIVSYTGSNIDNDDENDFFNMCLTRVGTHFTEGAKDLKPIIITTCNPTPLMFCKNIYNRYRSKTLREGEMVYELNWKDNPAVTDSLIKNWESITDEVRYKSMILGDWDCFKLNQAFMYSFNIVKHITIVPFSYDILWVSFDFNVSHMTCLMGYIGNNNLYIHKEFVLLDSNINEMLSAIKQYVKGKEYKTFCISGDASGRSRSVVLPKGTSLYNIICRELQVTDHFFKVPKHNLTHQDSQALCNSVFQQMDVRIDPSCKTLINELQSIIMTNKGIDKKDLSRGHILDCFRYLCHQFFDRIIF